MSALTRAFTALSLLAGAATAAVSTAQADEAQLARGKYLATIMDCAGCHTPMGPNGAPDMANALHGANYGFQLPGLGTFVPPNLTPDPTGLGGWTADELATAITTGVRPDGRILAPIMPWHSYGALEKGDLAALVAFLQSLPPYAYDAPGPFGPSEKPTVPYLGLMMP